MHDTFLLNNISKEIQSICTNKKIDRVKYLKIIVNRNSHVTVDNLSEHLYIHNNECIKKEITIEIIKGDVEDQTAIIEMIQGEQFE